MVNNGCPANSSGNPIGDIVDAKLALDAVWGFGNIPPLPHFPPGNTIEIETGQKFDISVQFMSPAGQTVTVSIADLDGAQAAGLVIDNHSPSSELAIIDLDWIVPTCADIGSYTLEFTATDNGSPPGQTVASLEINVVGAANPSVYVAWDEGPLLEEVHYFIPTSDPSYPDVELRRGSETWRVWSEDCGKPSFAGDIGTISAAAPENFALRIENPSGGPGARNVQWVNLVPIDSANYSRITGGTILGDLNQNLVVRRSSGGVGGEVGGNLRILGVARGIVEIYKVADGATIEVNTLDGGIIVGSHTSGSINVKGNSAAGGGIIVDGDSSAPILLGSNGLGTLTAGVINIGGNLTGPLTIGGLFTGSLCAANLDGNKPLPPNVQIATIGFGSQVCGVTADTTCATSVDAPAAEPQGVSKNRYISFIPGNAGTPAAIAVSLASLHHPASPPNPPDFTTFERHVLWVNAYRDASGNPVFTCPDHPIHSTTFACATLGCEPEYRDWGAAIGANTVLHVTGPAVVPSSTYHVHALPLGCAENWAVFSDAVGVETTLWGDVNGGGLSVVDVSSVVDRLRQLPTLPKHRLQLQQSSPNPFVDVNILDVSFAVDALKNFPYPFSGPTACP